MLAHRTSNEISGIEGVIRNICTTAVESDGLDFDQQSVQGERIVEEADYEGLHSLVN